MRKLSLAECEIATVFKTLFDESFQYSGLDSQEQDDLYQAFSTSYLQATGGTFTRSEFDWRAENWTFFGDVTGGIAGREQRSGMLKLVAAWGGGRKILPAYKELQKDYGNKPVWGVMTKDLAQALELISRKEFKIPPALFIKIVLPHIAKKLGSGISTKATKDGGIEVDTPSGKMIKYFVANKLYYQWVLDNVDTGNLPIPKIVAKGLIAIVRKLV